MIRTPVPKMPTWLEFVADESSIESKELARALGICVEALNDRILKGTFPAPDYTLGDFRQRLTGRPRLNHFMQRPHKIRKWRGKTVKQFFREHGV